MNSMASRATEPTHARAPREDDREDETTRSFVHARTVALTRVVVVTNAVGTNDLALLSTTKSDECYLV